MLLRSLGNLPPALLGGALAIGNFDGVHRGHARIVERLRAQARQVGGAAIAFTFDPHPAALLRPEACPPPLTWPERKAELLGALGVDAVVVYPTDAELLSLTAEEFYERLVCDRLAAKAMVEGPNFFFGRGRSGNVDTLRTLCAARNMTLEVVEPFAEEGELVSSSRVRELIQAGRIGVANQFLTAPYRLRGIVGHGAARGATIGFPTANLERIETVVPGFGVYAARAWIEGRPYAAAVNVGPNPTFGERATKLEVHVLDFSGDLYDRPLEVDFLDRLRDIQPFGSAAELISQLRRDVAEVREMCACAFGPPSGA